MAKTTARRTAWKPETISGKIAQVTPDQHLVAVETRDGVPFDMVVTANTRVTSGNQGITLKDLRRDMNKTDMNKTVGNVHARAPRRRGEVDPDHRTGSVSAPGPWRTSSRSFASHNHQPDVLEGAAGYCLLTVELIWWSIPFPGYKGVAAV